jgi:hypothetical protein
MVTIAEWYSRVNAAWPASVPKLTEEAAHRAARKLFRAITGRKLALPVVTVTGNRNTWPGQRGLNVNPGNGWRDFVHHLSHWLHLIVNRGEKPHSRAHARLELRMVRIVLARGWLQPAPPPLTLAAVNYTDPSGAERTATAGPDGVARGEISAVHSVVLTVGAAAPADATALERKAAAAERRAAKWKRRATAARKMATKWTREAAKIRRQAGTL